MSSWFTFLLCFLLSKKAMAAKLFGPAKEGHLDFIYLLLYTLIDKTIF